MTKKKHQAIICSYQKDFQWLEHCLLSLRRFATGYISPVICVDEADLEGARDIVARQYPECSIAVKNGRPGQGFMRAQIAMMQADLYCPHADSIHFIGSDCLAIKPFDASIYADEEGKPVVLYTDYRYLPSNHPWKPGTTRVLGFEPKYEFMRRLPSVFPASVFSPMRKHVENIHGMSFEDYIYEGDKARRDTSEANIVGAYAFQYMPETCRWVNTATEDLSVWKTGIGQNWSHGGLDRKSDTCYDYTIDGVTKNSHGRTPREIINDILYSGAIVT